MTIFPTTSLAQFLEIRDSLYSTSDSSQKTQEVLAEREKSCIISSKQAVCLQNLESHKLRATKDGMVSQVKTTNSPATQSHLNNDRS